MIRFFSMASSSLLYEFISSSSSSSRRPTSCTVAVNIDESVEQTLIRFLRRRRRLQKE